MKQILMVLASAIALIAAGCGSLFDDDSDATARQEQCWVEIYEDAQFVRETPWTRIQGPTEMSNVDNLAGRNWNDKISSIRVGPDAVVQVYEHAGFRGEVREYDYGRYIDNLDSDRLNDRISSLKIRCR
ncbi:MAG: hypothetical protein KY459_01210 [Acidobacteria bacterium]|nr:hypothetical protein [Acidobacteriota bacterium]